MDAVPGLDQPPGMHTQASIDIKDDFGPGRRAVRSSREHRVAGQCGVKPVGFLARVGVVRDDRRLGARRGTS
ncbi:hypothetical protein CG724_11705 [Streptomyces sp. CB02120-2]|nr:hypothetical protein A6A28_24360 [Streptomyces sp. CB03578]PJN18301.1 hypothetical protein CG724_11705 [Streptomyces sp. CB02120-2]